MSDFILIPFWIVPPSNHGPLGFGVTAYSLADALHIIESAGYSLPDDRSTLRVTEQIQVSNLEEPHVVRNMGPIVVRGIWYPFAKVGV
jgi:hypothetical protein